MISGFNKDTINDKIVEWTINSIICQLIKCSNQMKEDCITNSNFLRNKENKITNRLVAKYLNIESGIFHYETQSQETFNDNTDSFDGIVDIKVILCDHSLGEYAYFIIECKRIDGTTPLNKKYISEGVMRFLSPIENPKYSSYHKRNIMFGFVVKVIDIPKNTEKIDTLQPSLLDEVKASSFELIQSDNSQYYIYSCIYFTSDIEQIKLTHLFFDFSGVIRK